MLSILIPTYNFNIFPLVKEVHRQASELQITFEILVYDDASSKTFDHSNASIAEFSHCYFKKLPVNIGRSAIRNTLSNNAQYESLLFIDAGTMPENNAFIAKYIALINNVAVTGGMTYKKEPIAKPYKLRWLYTKNRELNYVQNKQISNLFHSSNFLIQKWALKKHPFDESLKGYGYEDLLFYDLLLKNGITVDFVNNPVIHMADDTTSEFIAKSEQGLQNLHGLITSKQLSVQTSGISKTYSKLNVFGLQYPIAWTYKIFKPLLLLNLKSSYPSLKLFDMYRLGYFCSIKNNR